MANIMITKKCNLKCPYCFANEFVNKNNTDMKIKDFLAAIDFIMTNPEETIGIIGGEPTIHPQFKEMLEILIEDNRVQRVIIFTNGINLEQYINQLVHPKFAILINCNSPSDMGETAYKKLWENLDILVNQYYMRDRITLGINLYKTNFDYEYILNMLQEFHFPILRTSISVPNTEELKNTDAITYFNERKENVLKFYYTLLENHIMPFYDCNMLPSCVLSDQERNTLACLIKESGLEDKNLLSDISICQPVIDILPNLEAIRCFALSDAHKAKIKDFNNIFELKEYFRNIFDVYAYNLTASENCRYCFKNKTAKCSGGCYAFKIKKILAAQKKVHELDISSL